MMELLVVFGLLAVAGIAGWRVGVRVRELKRKGCVCEDRMPEVKHDSVERYILFGYWGCAKSEGEQREIRREFLNMVFSGKEALDAFVEDEVRKLEGEGFAVKLYVEWDKRGRTANVRMVDGVVGDGWDIGAEGRRVR